MRPVLLILLSISVVFPAIAGDQPRDYMRHYVVSGTFEDVRDDVELAITGRGIKINNVAHIGKMLARTGKDLGGAKEVFTEAQAFEFCSATVSRATMEADPHNIVFCPYVIAVYALPNESNKVHIAFRRPLFVGTAASKASLEAVDKLLADIVSEVAN
ncbi:MAG: DUF302 domain-containing protein [Pseudomonadota bacterium]|nr:MAG: DUF302 domain-containing protein [Pseudomonadota bacterium]